MKKIKTEIEENVIPKEYSDSLRPKDLSQYIGQEKIKTNLKLSIAAAKQRNVSLDHFLFSGPPGLGKTSLAHVIASEMNSNIRVVSAPVIEKTGDMASILAMLEEKDVLFVDEIHRLPKPVEEMLYSAMEDYKVDIIVGSMGQAKAITLELPRFTLIGATTRKGMLSKPLLDRFQNHYDFEYYSLSDIGKIVESTSIKLDTPFPDDILEKVAGVCRGTPRVAINITKKLSDYCLVKKVTLDEKHLKKALAVLGYDLNGFTDLDRKYLNALENVFAGKPVGLNTLAAFLGESEDTIKETIEPYLLQKGIIIRTHTGRMLNKKEDENA